MNHPGKKFLSLFLVFSLMMLSLNLYAKERRGAKLRVTKLDGQQVEGELITVKPNSLLLLNAEGKDVSVDVVDIRTIRIVKKSKALSGAGIGLLIGGGIGLLGVLTAEGGEFLEGLEYFIGGVIAGGSAIIGAIIGLASGADIIIQIEGKSDKKIRDTLKKLRKKARVRDYK